MVGDVLLRAQLRTRDEGGADGGIPALGGSSRRSAGAAEEQARIIARGDRGFCREEMMAWCETPPEVYDCGGLAKNSLLL